MSLLLAFESVSDFSRTTEHLIGHTGKLCNLYTVAFVCSSPDDLAEEYDIVSIPCLIVFKDGEEADRSVGLISADELAGLADV